MTNPVLKRLNQHYFHLIRIKKLRLTNYIFNIFFADIVLAKCLITPVTRVKER